MAGFCSIETIASGEDAGTITTYYAHEHFPLSTVEIRFVGCMNEAAFAVNGEHACYEHLTAVVELHLIEGNQADVRAVEDMVDVRAIKREVCG